MPAGMLLPSGMRKISLPLLATTLLTTVLVSACSPKFNWRDYRSNDAPYTVQFPGKPAQQTRTVDLDGQQVSLTMTATEIDGTTFAVASGELPDATHAQMAMVAMKTAMIKNIDGVVSSDKMSAVSSGDGANGGQQTSIDIEATGSQSGVPMLLSGKFISKGKRVYQVIVVGHQKEVVRDTVDTFMGSFKLN
jgi:hypothetical protein